MMSMNSNEIIGSLNYIGMELAADAQFLRCLARPLNLSKASEAEKADAQVLFDAADVLDRMAAKANECASTMEVSGNE